jgi:hypothetical protein
MKTTQERLSDVSSNNKDQSSSGSRSRRNLTARRYRRLTEHDKERGQNPALLFLIVKKGRGIRSSRPLLLQPERGGFQ